MRMVYLILSFSSSHKFVLLFSFSSHCFNENSVVLLVRQHKPLDFV